MDGIRGITLKINFKDIEIIDGTKIKAGAGVLLTKLSNVALENSLTGIEFACGIPGTLGGAIKMNAGAYGSEIKDVLVSTTYLDEKLELHTITNEENEFSYRNSRFFKNKKDIIISAILNLEKGIKEDIELKINKDKESRKKNQPLDMPSAGSAFKRENRIYSSPAYRQMWLKGL